MGWRRGAFAKRPRLDNAGFSLLLSIMISGAVLMTLYESVQVFNAYYANLSQAEKQSMDVQLALNSMISYTEHAIKERWCLTTDETGAPGDNWARVPCPNLTAASAVVPLWTDFGYTMDVTGCPVPGASPSPSPGAITAPTANGSGLYYAGATEALLLSPSTIAALNAPMAPLPAPTNPILSKATMSGTVSMTAMPTCKVSGIYGVKALGQKAGFTSMQVVVNQKPNESVGTESHLDITVTGHFGNTGDAQLLTKGVVAETIGSILDVHVSETVKTIFYPRQLAQYGLIIAGDLILGELLQRNAAGDPDSTKAVSVWKDAASQAAGDPPVQFLQDDGSKASLKVPMDNSVMIPSIKTWSSTAGVQGIKFLSPVFVNGNIVVPAQNPTGGCTNGKACAPVRFASNITIGGGYTLESGSDYLGATPTPTPMPTGSPTPSPTPVATPPGQQAHLFSPIGGHGIPMTSTLSGFQGVLQGVNVDGVADAGLTYLFGTNSLPASVESYLDCSEWKLIQTYYADRTKYSNTVIRRVTTGSSWSSALSVFQYDLGLTDRDQFIPQAGISSACKIADSFVVAGGSSNCLATPAPAAVPSSHPILRITGSYGRTTAGAVGSPYDAPTPTPLPAVMPVPTPTPLPIPMIFSAELGDNDTVVIPLTDKTRKDQNDLNDDYYVKSGAVHADLDTTLASLAAIFTTFVSTNAAILPTGFSTLSLSAMRSSINSFLTNTTSGVAWADTNLATATTNLLNAQNAMKSACDAWTASTVFSTYTPKNFSNTCINTCETTGCSCPPGNSDTPHCNGGDTVCSTAVSLIPNDCSAVSNDNVALANTQSAAAAAHSKLSIMQALSDLKALQDFNNPANQPQLKIQTSPYVYKGTQDPASTTAGDHVHLTVTLIHAEMIPNLVNRLDLSMEVFDVGYLQSDPTQEMGNNNRSSALFPGPNNLLSGETGGTHNVLSLALNAPVDLSAVTPTVPTTVEARCFTPDFSGGSCPTSAPTVPGAYGHLTEFDPAVSWSPTPPSICSNLTQSLTPPPADCSDLAVYALGSGDVIKVSSLVSHQAWIPMSFTVGPNRSLAPLPGSTAVVLSSDITYAADLVSRKQINIDGSWQGSSGNSCSWSLDTTGLVGSAATYINLPVFQTGLGGPGPHFGPCEYLNKSNLFSCFSGGSTAFPFNPEDLNFAPSSFMSWYFAPVQDASLNYVNKVELYSGTLVKAYPTTLPHDYTMDISQPQYQPLLISSAQECVIDSSVTTVAGFLVCGRVRILGNRTKPLAFYGTVITGGIYFEDSTIMKQGITWTNIYHPQAVTYLKTSMILAPSKTTQCPLVPSPSAAPWMKTLTNSATDPYSRKALQECDPDALLQGAIPLSWSAVDPDCGFAPTTGPEGLMAVCKEQSRPKRYIIEETSRSQ